MMDVPTLPAYEAFVNEIDLLARVVRSPPDLARTNESVLEERLRHRVRRTMDGPELRRHCFQGKYLRGDIRRYTI